MSILPECYNPRVYIFMGTLFPVLPDTERRGGRRLVLGRNGQRGLSPALEEQLNESRAVHRLLER